MKDQRFIELLNLYIDRQITADETAELEVEIQRDPRRQAVYRQYCQIHAATKLVYESFRSGATEPAAAGPAHPATVEQFGRRRRGNWVHYVGGFAAAAAAVGLLMVRSQSHSSAPVQPATLAAVPVAVVAPIVTAAAPAVQAPLKAITLRSTSASAAPNYSAILAALREQDEERAMANERWQTAKAPSLFDDHLFDATRPVSDADPRPAQSRSTAAQQTEFTAFQFQR